MMGSKIESRVTIHNENKPSKKRVSFEHNLVSGRSEKQGRGEERREEERTSGRTSVTRSAVSRYPLDRMSIFHVFGSDVSGSDAGSDRSMCLQEQAK